MQLFAARILVVGLILFMAVIANAESSVQEQALRLAADIVKNSEPETPADNTQGNARSEEKVSQAETSAPEQASYPGIQIMRIQSGGSGEPAVNITYPRFGQPKVDAMLKEFAEARVKAFESEVGEVNKDEEEMPASYGAWELTGFYTLEYPNPNVASVLFNIYTYTGGAHGDLDVVALNFDLKTGTQISFDQLFAHPQKAVELLSRICEAKLRKALGEDVEEDMLKDGIAPAQENFNNLSLLPTGVAVEFQPYQVGPWSIGQQVVEVSLDELAAASPNPQIWPELSKQ